MAHSARASPSRDAKCSVYFPFSRTDVFTMSARKLIALGTSSQVPTRHRNHNGYLLRWDEEGFLFDPGEGTQRQMTFAGIAASAIHRVFITHFHGDHCL